MRLPMPILANTSNNQNWRGFTGWVGFPVDYTQLTDQCRTLRAPPRAAGFFFAYQY